MRLEAYAKINWALGIVGRRDDGYHLLDMLMQRVSLRDTLYIEACDELSLTVPGSHLPSDERNLVTRAALLLRETYGVTNGARLRLIKRIPERAGLGGGSADAASALLGLARLWGLDCRVDHLAKLALLLGADVPYCLAGGLARVRGIGEQVELIPGAARWPLVIVKPCEGLSAREVYEAYSNHSGTLGASESSGLSRLDIPAIAYHLTRGDFESLRREARNALQAAAISLRPEITRAIKCVERLGASFVTMSGSGAAVFGVFENDSAAQTAFEALKTSYSECFLAHTMA